MSLHAVIERRSAILQLWRKRFTSIARDNWCLIWYLILSYVFERASENLATDNRMPRISEAKSDIHFLVSEERKYIKNLKRVKAKIIALYCLGFIV